MNEQVPDIAGLDIPILERTDLAQQYFSGAVNTDRSQLEAWGVSQATETETQPLFYGSRQKFFDTVQQNIEAGEEYPVDPIWQEDHMIEQLDSLLDRQVITDREHMAIFASWIMKRRPDTKAMVVQPKPRGYGRGYLNE